MSIIGLPSTDAAPIAHDSIFIEGDAGFNPSNGVSSGSGTWQDPYIIEDLEITGPDRWAIHIKDAKNHVLLRNLTISNASGADVGIQFENADNGIVQNVTMEDLVMNIYIIHSSLITVRDCMAVGGKIDISASDNVTIMNYTRTAGSAGVIHHGLLATYVEELIVIDCSLSDLGAVGIQLESCTDFYVTDNEVKNITGQGIVASIGKGPYCIISNNVVDACLVGIVISNVDDVEVMNNEIVHNSGYGLEVMGSRDVVLADNRFQYHGMFLEEVICNPDKDFRNNTIVDIPIHFSVGDSDLVIDGGVSQVFLLGATNCSMVDLTLLGPTFVRDSSFVRIEDCQVSDTILGISVNGSRSVSIECVDFSNLTMGVELRNVDDVSIVFCSFDLCGYGIYTYCDDDNWRVDSLNHSYVRNTFQDDEVGIFLKRVKWGNVTANTMTDTTKNAIEIETCTYYNFRVNQIVRCDGAGFYIISGGWMDISLNTVEATSNGTLSWSMSNCDIQYNYILNSIGWGINIRGDTNMNRIIGNQIIGSKMHGLIINRGSNIIHHNNFTGNYWSSYLPNPPQVADGSRGANLWDDGSEGNYWSDYLDKYPNATRVGSVWSIPYLVSDYGSGELYDRYPLVKELPHQNQPLSANAGPDFSVIEGSEVQFDGSGSTDDGGNTTYIWSFTDGEVLVVLTGPAPLYTFQSTGVYQVELQVYDESGNNDTDYMTVTVLDITPPLAEAGEDIVTAQFGKVTFDGSLTFDPSGIFKYKWTFQIGDETVELSGVSPSYQFDEPGEYQVTLEVTDGMGHTSTDTLTVIVRDGEPPVAVTGEDITIAQGETVELDASASYDNVGIEMYFWTIYVGDDNVLLDGAIVYHTFHNAGEFIVVLRVSDAVGNEGVTDMTVTVRDTEPPTIELGEDVTVKAGEDVVLDGTDWTDNVRVVNFTWEIRGPPEDVTLYGERVTHVFSEETEYHVTLIVTDSEGNEAFDTFMVRVEGSGQSDENSGNMPFFVLSMVILALISVFLVAVVILRGRRTEER